jgi:Thiamine pyrophosphate enzyme, N-terminal TPP binding domain
VSTVREVTYQLLRDLDMKIIFGNPGSTELPFLRDLPSDFTYVLGLHERVAAGMALGYAMGTGNTTFVNLHSDRQCWKWPLCYPGRLVQSRTTGDHDRTAGPPTSFSRTVPGEPSCRDCQAIREMGVRAATRRRCACSDRPRMLSRDTATDGASIHFNSHG